MIINYKLLDDEVFFGGAINDGIYMPFDKETTYEIDMNIWHSGNQASALIFSNKGKIYYSVRPMKIKFEKGNLTLDGHDIKEYQSDVPTIQGTHKYICNHIFKECKSYPDLAFFEHPQFNTWIEMEWDCTEKKVLNYAKKITSNGYGGGILMIDDCWCEDYGVWEFDKKKFAHPKKMMETLHNLGFKVMLWVCPYISPDSKVYRELEPLGYLLKNSKGETYISHWWNGYSAVLDLTNPEAVKWIEGQFDYLMKEYGVDGFKLDACDPEWYYGDTKFMNSEDISSQATIWCEIGEKYDLAELRVGFNNGISSCAHRLRDKRHSWDEEGLNTLIPDAILEGLMGYPYLCPDMIGGGMVPDFHNEGFHFDQELFVRYAQVSAMFPMMQFSLAPWKCLSKKNQAIVLEAVELHRSYYPTIVEAVKKAVDGTPIVRSVAYQTNDDKYASIMDEFFLGDDILVCPQVKKEKSRSITIPEGTWIDELGNTYEEGTYTIKTPLNRIPVFKRK